MTNSENDYTINLPVVKGWALVILTGLLVFWIRGEYVAIGKMLDPLYRILETSPSDYFQKWCIWSVAGIPLIGGWLWNLTGHESIVISNDSLLLKKQIGPFKLIRHLRTSLVSRLRNESNYSSRLFQLLGWGGNLAIEHDGRDYRFGLLLNESEAEQIADSLRARIPRLQESE